MTRDNNEMEKSNILLFTLLLICYTCKMKVLEIRLSIRLEAPDVTQHPEIEMGKHYYSTISKISVETKDD